jgi:hypothetical protein
MRVVQVKSICLAAKFNLGENSKVTVMQWFQQQPKQLFAKSIPSADVSMGCLPEDCF